MRWHPYVLRGIQAVEQRNAIALGDAVLGHGGHPLRSLWGSRVHAPLVGNVLTGRMRRAARLSTVRYRPEPNLSFPSLGTGRSTSGLTRARLAGVAAQALVREPHLSGATTTPRKPALSIAALTSPSDFASSMNWRAYATPGSRPFGIAMACGSMPG